MVPSESQVRKNPYPDRELGSPVTYGELLELGSEVHNMAVRLDKVLAAFDAVGGLAEFVKEHHQSQITAIIANAKREQMEWLFKATGVIAGLATVVMTLILVIK